MKFLIFEEYMIERVTFLQSILFFLAFSEIERSLTNLLWTALPIQETRKKIPLFV